MDTPIVPSNTQYNSHVYEPAEDTFLLLDALEQDLPQWIKLNLSAGEGDDRASTEEGPYTGDLLCLEVGTGSGIIATALASYSVEPSSPKLFPCVLALDVNPSACFLAQATAEVNRVGTKVEPVLLDGTLLPQAFRLPHLFDLIVCNPPYVPVMPEEKFELSSGGLLESYLEKSWDGGPDGNSFIIPFLKDVGELLSPTGALYLLLSSWNEPEMLMETVAKHQDLHGHCVIKRQAGRERLSVWRLAKKTQRASNNNDKGQLISNNNNTPANTV